MDENLPDRILQLANATTEESLPPKSADKYIYAYNHFNKWRSQNDIGNSLQEGVVLAYFKDHDKTWKASTMWAKFSMIATLVSLRHDGLDITKYKKVQLFLSRKLKDHTPVQAKVLTSAQLNTFINSAPDDKYIFTKVSKKKNN